MPQIFHPAANTVARFSIVGTAGLLVIAGWLLLVVSRSDYVTEVNVVRNQPVEFSHQHHVGGLGMDCRYCHTSVEDSNMAGIPPTETCMGCHRHIWRDSPELAAVREGFESGRPLRWTRVHDLPDFVYFNHRIHVKKGVACATCHGQLDQMPLTRRAHTLHMQWCLECHRNPESRLSPRQDVFASQPSVAVDSAQRDRAGSEPAHLTHCSVCHR